MDLEGSALILRPTSYGAMAGPKTKQNSPVMLKNSVGLEGGESEKKRLFKRCRRPIVGLWLKKAAKEEQLRQLDSRFILSPPDS